MITVENAGDYYGFNLAVEGVEECGKQRRGRVWQRKGNLATDMADLCRRRNLAGHKLCVMKSLI